MITDEYSKLTPSGLLIVDMETLEWDEYTPVWGFCTLVWGFCGLSKYLSKNDGSWATCSSKSENMWINDTYILIVN